MFMTLNPPPVIFDEVQLVKGLFRYIKIKCDESDESDERGMYCLTGSQPFELMEGVSELLSGRVGIIELAGLSLREIMGDGFSRPFLPTMEYMVERSKSVKTPGNIWEIIHKGGYP